MAKRCPAAVLISSLIVLTACGGGASSSGTTGSSLGSTSSSRAAMAISTWCPGVGAILVKGKGYPLSASTADTAQRSACTGSCATIWSPIVISGVPKFAPGLKKSLVGDVVRADGSHQLTY